MDTVMISSVLSASILGSLHCVGMCGGLVTLYAGQASRTMPPSVKPASVKPVVPEWRLHLGYNLGRLSIYLILGLVAGLLGAGLNLAGTLLEFQDMASRLAGAWMVVWGLHTLGRYLNLLPELPNPLKRLGARTFPIYQWLGRRPGMFSSFGIGLLSAVLPCGWLYLFVGAAAGAGSALEGAAVMGIFWLGTVPAMASLGMVVRRISGALRSKLPVAAALLLVCAGLYTITHKWENRGAGLMSFQRGTSGELLTGQTDGAPSDAVDHACGGH